MTKSFLSVLLLTATATAQSSFGPIFTYYQQGRVTDHAVGDAGASMFLAFPNVGGTGSSAGKVTLLDNLASGSVVWSKQAGYEMLAAEVDAAANTAALVAVTAERTVSGGAIRTRMFAWSDAGASSSTPSYTVTMDAGDKLGAHMSENGIAVGWCWTSTNGLTVYTCDTATGLIGGEKFTQVTSQPLQSVLSADGTTLYVEAMDYNYVFHIDDDSSTAISQSSMYPTLFEGFTAGQSFASAGLASSARDVSVRMSVIGSNATIYANHSNFYDWNYNPSAPTEHGLWKTQGFTTGGTYPVALAISPDGNTLFTGLLSPLVDLGGFGTIDLSSQTLPLATSGMTLVQYPITGLAAYTFYSDIKFMNDTTVVAMSRIAGTHGKLTCWTKQGSTWGPAYTTDWSISDHFNNRLAVNPANRAAALRYGNPPGGNLGTYITLYNITP